MNVAMNGHRAAVGFVWTGTLAAAVLVASLVHGPLVWAVLTLVLAVAVVVALAVQLVGAEREGFVTRLAASVCGAFVAVVATGLVVLAASAAGA